MNISIWEKKGGSSTAPHGKIKNIKYQIFDDLTKRTVSFGQMSYEDYIHKT